MFHCLVSIVAAVSIFLSQIISPCVAYSDVHLKGKEGLIAGAIGAFIAETMADALSPDKPMSRINELEEEKGRALTKAEFTEAYQDSLKDYPNRIGVIESWSKLTAATATLLAGQDVTTAILTANNAIENNFVHLAMYGVAAAAVMYEAYELRQIYRTQGVEAALKQLGISVVVGAATGVVVGTGAKLIYKIGLKVYPTAQAAIAAALETQPGLKLALGGMVDTLSAAVDKLNASTIGKAVGKIEAHIAKAENKILQKVGLGKVTPETEFKKLDWSGYSRRTKSSTAHHIQINHGQLKLDKKDQGVFYGDPIKVVEESWIKANREAIVPIEIRNTQVYIVHRPNSGYDGGIKGQRTNFDYVTIVTKKDTSQIITAYPSGSTPKPPVDYIPFE